MRDGTRRIPVMPVPANAPPRIHHGLCGGFRIVRSCNRRHHEPAGCLGYGQIAHIGERHATADNDRIIAGSTDGVDQVDAQEMLATVILDDDGIRLGGGGVQRRSADVVDAAARQFVDEFDEAFGFRAQADDGIVAEQLSRLARVHVVLPDMHAVDLDTQIAALPDDVHAVVDDEGDCVRLVVVFDDLRDIPCGFGQLLGIRGFVTQLDEGGAALQRVIDDIADRATFGVLRPKDAVGGQIEGIAHGGVGVVGHGVSFCCWADCDPWF